MVFVGQNQGKKYQMNPLIEISSYNRQIIKNIIVEDVP